MIEALPAVLEKFPNVVYIVLGATHPHVALREGESYRLRLERLARARKVDRHVIFHNRFVSLEELTEFIGAADIYLTPYLNRAQIVSGTLAYTVGMGKAVVSTPYWYAEELLEDGRGLLVPFRDPSALAERIRALLEHDGERHAMRKRAWLLGREMIWPRVARQYVEVFERARELRATHPRPAFAAVTLEQRPLDLPPLKLDHLRTLTDGTGVLQHAIFTVPNYNEGYTTDDNARALALAVLLEQVGEHFPLAPRYLGFLWHAYNSAVGRLKLSRLQPGLARRGGFGGLPRAGALGPGVGAGAVAKCWVAGTGGAIVRSGLARHVGVHQSESLGLRPDRGGRVFAAVFGGPRGAERS